MAKRLPAMRETWVRSLGWENLLEKEMATHSSILAWRIPRMDKPGRLQSMRLQRVGHDWTISLTHFHFDNLLNEWFFWYWMMEASLVAQVIKNLPAMWETWVWSLVSEDPLKKGMATHSSILSWKIPLTIQSYIVKKSDTTEWLTLSLLILKDIVNYIKLF